MRVACRARRPALLWWGWAEMGLLKASRRQTASSRLRVDPVACDGIGMCAHLAPSLVRLDTWGFPLLPEHALDTRGEREAGRAVSGCPRRALFVERERPADQRT